MESVASNNTQAVIKNCPVFAGRRKDAFHECKSKARVCLTLYSKPVFEVYQGEVQPSPTTLGSTDTATLNVVAEQKWQQASQDLWSILLLTTSGSANNTVKKFEGKRPEDGAGHGQVAWKALTENCSGHTKEAKRASQEKLTQRWSPARIETTYFSSWTSAVTSSKKWTCSTRREVRRHHPPSPS